MGVFDTRQGGEGSTLDQKAGRVTDSERSARGVKGAAVWDCCVSKLKVRANNRTDGRTSGEGDKRQLSVLNRNLYLKKRGTERLRRLDLDTGVGFG